MNNYYEIISKSEPFHKLRSNNFINIEELANGGVEATVLTSAPPRLHDFIIDDAIEDPLIVEFEDGTKLSLMIDDSFNIHYSSRSVDKGIDRLGVFIWDVMTGNVSYSKARWFKSAKVTTLNESIKAKII